MLPLFRTSRQIAGFVFLLGLTLLLSMTLIIPNQVNAQSTTLGTAATFAVLGGQTVTNTGASVINGDLGVSPGTAVTGFPPGLVTPPGTIHAADATALQAQNDLTTRYNALAGAACDQNLSGQDLGGLTLTAGVYCFATSAQLTGDLTLDAQGNPAAVFIFQIGSTLTTASASRVLFTNGAVDCNLWWQVGSSATLGTNSTFAGNILALTSITLTTGANVTGRALARNGSVTLDTNVVGPSACFVPPVPGLSLTKDDGGGTVAPGGTISYTLNYQNTGNVDLNNVTLSDTIPTDTTFNAGASTAGWNCGVSPCTFDLGTLAVGAGGSVVFAVTVNNPTAAVLITNNASIASGGTTANAGDTTGVTPPPPPVPGLSLTKTDGGVTVAPGGVISYTLTFQNTGNTTLNNVILTDTIPADTTFNAGASTPGWNCGVSPCTFNLGTLQPGDGGSAVFAVTVNNPTGAAQITNSAGIASGVTNASAGDTTPVIQPPPVVPTTVPGGGATAVPTAFPTASPTPFPLQLFTATPSVGSGSGAGSGQRSVSGLPNTGGGPPQATYWMREQD